MGGRTSLLLKPLTYMNESGRAVGAAARFFKLDPSDIVALHDEIDLAPGKVRTKAGGGHAGHNGVRSLHAHLGPGYRRIRIGVGHPGGKERVTGHVLGAFGAADKDWIGPLLDAIADAAPLLAGGDDDRFQSRVAYLTRPPDGAGNGRKGAADGR